MKRQSVQSRHPTKGHAPKTHSFAVTGLVHQCRSLTLRFDLVGRELRLELV
jgi:hypothetical protein